MPKRPGKHRQIEYIDPTLSPKAFFSQFISKRKPVVIKGLPNDPRFHGTKWTDLSYLSQKAGDVQIMVEPIHPAAKQYGTDVERISMSFRDFLASLQEDDGVSHPYLTTQYSEEDPDAETVFPPPTNALKDDFPVVPSLMGNLFLQQVNLWLGKSKHGSSSGLHHDFHDNLYCLLQGSKRFVLFPPSEVKHLSPYGTLETLHPNGLIAYTDMPVRSDGLPRRTACKARVRALEFKIAALKAAEKGRAKGKGKGKEKAPSKEMQGLMEAHDAALDELAMATLDDPEGDDEVDDFDALMDGLGGSDEGDGHVSPGRGESGSDEEDEDGDEDKAEEEEEEWKGIRVGHSDSSSSAGSDSDAESATAPSPPEPSSFSRIPPALLHDYLGLPTTAVLPRDCSEAEFPGLSKTAAPYVVELSAGEMLYLPASWWHEVTSTSSSRPDPGENDPGPSSDIHMAFNYWFYPPDALDNFEAPYADAVVWAYLREKAGGLKAETRTETVQKGKRQPSGEDIRGSHKKARR